MTAMNTPAALIASSQKLRDVAVQPVMQRRLQQLQRWQVTRLRRTYDDFSSQSRYHDALEFFVNDLYGPHDCSQRDTELSKVLRAIQRVLPAQAVQALTLALQMESLSLSLDIEMAEVLDDGDITSALYQKAYQDVGRTADRQQQVVLIVAAGRALDGLVRNPAIGAALWVAALPARIAGVSMLHDFLKRGYHAFSRMQGAGTLLAAIEQRETIIMKKLFSAASSPFEWQRSELIHASEVSKNSS